MAHKDKFGIGDKVSFYRTHDKSLKLTGTVVGVHPDKNTDFVSIKTDVDGKIIEVSRVEEAHGADVTLIEKAKKSEAKTA